MKEHEGERKRLEAEFEASVRELEKIADALRSEAEEGKAVLENPLATEQEKRDAATKIEALERFIRQFQQSMKEIDAETYRLIKDRLVLTEEGIRAKQVGR